MVSSRTLCLLLLAGAAAVASAQEIRSYTKKELFAGQICGDDGPDWENKKIGECPQGYNGLRKFVKGNPSDMPGAVVAVVRVCGRSRHAGSLGRGVAAPPGMPCWWCSPAGCMPAVRRHAAGCVTQGAAGVRTCGGSGTTGGWARRQPVVRWQVEHEVAWRTQPWSVLMPACVPARCCVTRAASRPRGACAAGRAAAHAPRGHPSPRKRTPTLHTRPPTTHAPDQASTRCRRTGRTATPARTRRCALSSSRESPSASQRRTTARSSWPRAPSA
jgi:hypothetical protein